MLHVQIFVVLLSLISVCSLVSSLMDGVCYDYDNYQLASKQSRAGNHHLTSKQCSCEHSPSYCGNTSAINLKCPFGFKGHRPDSCSEFELACDKHNRIALFMYPSLINTQYLYVELDSIDYGKQTIRVIDPGVQKNNCSALPLYSFRDSYYFKHPMHIDEDRYYFEHPMHIDQDMDVLIFVSCKNPVRSKSPLYVDTTTCNITEKQFSNVKAPSNYSYVVVGENLVASDIEESCTIHKIVPAELQCLPNINGGDISFEDIHNLLANGFKLTWSYGDEPSTSRTFYCKCTDFNQVFTGSSVQTEIGLDFVFMPCSHEFILVSV